MPVTYRLSPEGVSVRQLEDLFEAADLGGRVGDKIRRAFLNSSVVCLAYDGDRLVGASRAMTDGEYHGSIYDVAVHPEYQGLGIGRSMIAALLDRMPVWRVVLVADGDVQEFYRKLGFEKYPGVMARLDWSRLYDSGLK